MLRRRVTLSILAPTRFTLGASACRVIVPPQWTGVGEPDRFPPTVGSDRRRIPVGCDRRL